MIQAINEEERHTIPRWNTLSTAEKLGELESSVVCVPRREHRTSNIDKLLSTWKTEKNLPLAVEILAENESCESPREVGEVYDFARDAVLKMESVPELLADFLQLSERDSSAREQGNLPPIIKQDIGRLRKYLISYPRNPLLWVELGRIYLIAGNFDKSERSLKTAITLAPNNRTTLRAFARFFTHQRDYDRALYILRKADSLKGDPWLLSAEIAISNEAGKTSRYIKDAQIILENEKYSSRAVSELGSELATLDFFSGNSKKGKKKLQTIVADPYENAVAQMIWINENCYKIPTIVGQIVKPECNYEAEMMVHYSENDYDAALNSTLAWKEYQPFSSSPVLMASYLLCDFFLRYDEAANILEPTILNNPNSIELLNNYAYALIMLGRFNEAANSLRKAHTQRENVKNIPLIATEGLLLYRTGKVTEGYQKYQEAILLAKKENNSKLLFELYLHLAREEMIVGNPTEYLMDIINSAKYREYNSKYQVVLENFDLMGDNRA